jgi:hypothetical protein
MKTLVCTAFLAVVAAGAFAQPAPYPANRRIQAVVDQISADSILANITRLSAFHTRHTFSDTLSDSVGIGAAMRWVQSRAGSFHADSVWRFPWTQNWDGQLVTCYNLNADVRGTAANRARYLIGSHLDSRGADLNDDTVFAPGADDNGSSCAALLEILRVLPDTIRNDLEMIWFSGEEQGLYGSAAYALNQQQTSARIDGMICPDMISHIRTAAGAVDSMSCRLYADAAPGLAGTANASRNLERYLRWVGQEYVAGFSMQVNAAGDRPGRGSDHLSFSDRNFPSLRVIETNEDLAYQHGPNDIPANTTPTYARRIAQVTCGALLTMLDAPPRTPKPVLTAQPEGGGILVTVPDSVALDSGGHFLLSIRDLTHVDYDSIVNLDTARSYVWAGGVVGTLYAFGLSRTDAEGLPSPFTAEAMLRYPNAADDHVILWPSSFNLSAAPNPFNATTVISFTVPHEANVRISVYDLTGREVKMLVEGRTELGEHRVRLDGEGMTSGIYFVRMESAGASKTAKITLLR